MVLLMVLACGDEDPGPALPPIPDAPLVPQAPETPPLPPESQAAAPAWWSGLGYAPPVTGTVLSANRARPEQLEGHVLACAITVTYKGREVGLGSWAEPDLTLQLGAGANPERDFVHWVVDDNTSEVEMGVSLVRMTPGDAVALTVHERDGTRSQQISALSVPWDGAWPLVLQDNVVDARCAPLLPSTIAGAAAELLERTQKSLDRAEPVADLGFEDMGRDEWAERPVETLLAAAALVGWSDPRMAPLLEQHAGLTQDFVASISDAVAAAGTDAVQASTLQISVVAHHAQGALPEAWVGEPGVPTDSAVIALRVQNQGDEGEGLGPSDVGPVRFDLVDDTGKRVELELHASQSGTWRRTRSGSVPAGGERVLLYAYDAAALSGPPTLRARWSDRGLQYALVRLD
jgi:hypothetical protein